MVIGEIGRNGGLRVAGRLLEERFSRVPNLMSKMTTVSLSAKLKQQQEFLKKTKNSKRQSSNSA